MSLDGYIAGPDDGPGNPGGDGFMRPHEWLATADGDSGRPPGPAGEMHGEMEATGAVLVGRRTAEQAGHYKGNHHGVPIVVVSLVPAVLALMRLLGHTRPVWALTADSLAGLGILIGIGDSATQLVFWQMGAPRRQPRPDGRAGHPLQLRARSGADLHDRRPRHAVREKMLVSAGLCRARAIPAWTAAAIPAATIANIAGLSANSVPITIASFALLLAAFVRVAVTVRTSPAWPQALTATPAAGSVLPART